MTVPITRSASANVTMMWLVTVNDPGTMPSRFSVSTNMKSEKTSGKNFIPSRPVASVSVPATNSCSVSAAAWRRSGTTARLRVA